MDKRKTGEIILGQETVPTVNLICTSGLSSRQARRRQEREARRAGRKAARIAIRNEEKKNG